MNVNKNIYLIIIILSFIFSCQQKSAKQNFIKTIEVTSNRSIPTFLIYGESLSDEYTEEKDSLATQKFGFNLMRVADCETTKELIDSVKIINKNNSLIMKSKYGDNWKEKFETQAKLKLEIPEIE